MARWVEKLEHPATRMATTAERALLRTLEGGCHVPVGGFAEYGLMEDAHLCRDLERIGKLVLVPSILPTSARRFLAGGVLRVLWLDVRIWLTDQVGGDVQRFAERYREENLAP